MGGTHRAAIDTEQRPRPPDGRHGSLHATAAVADGKALFISSTNLTEDAMALDMELGVLRRAPVRIPGRHWVDLLRGVSQGSRGSRQAVKIARPQGDRTLPRLVLTAGLCRSWLQYYNVAPGDPKPVGSAGSRVRRSPSIQLRPNSGGLF